MTKIIIVAVIFLAVLVSGCSTDKKEVHFFYSNTCTDCITQDLFMKRMIAQNPDISIIYHDVEKQFSLWESMCAKYDTKPETLPMTFAGGKVFAGFRDSDGLLVYNNITDGYTGYKNQIEIAIKS